MIFRIARTAARSPRVMGLVAIGLLLASLSGCVLFEKNDKPPEPPMIPCSQVLTRWKTHVHYTSDSLNPGRTVSGIVGRVYLFNEESHKAVEVDAKGKITAVLYDMAPVKNHGEPKQLAVWDYDPVTLKKMKREDMLGQGYTLFLPWEPRADVTHIKLEVFYTDRENKVHWGSPDVMSLQADAPPMIQQRVQPVVLKEAAKQ